jgi:hypothetical protein
LPEVPLYVGTFEAPNSVLAFLLIDAPQRVLAAVLGNSAEKAFALFLRRNGKLAPSFVPAVVLDEPAERSGGETWNRPRPPSLDELKPDVPSSELASRNRLASYQLSHSRQLSFPQPHKILRTRRV